MLTSYKLWKSICLRNDLPLGNLKYYFNNFFFDNIYSSIHFREIDMTTKKIWRFHQIPPSIVQGRGGMMPCSAENCLSVFDHFVGLVLRGQKPMLQSFRAQSLHLQLKSIDWFLYDRNISQYKR